MITCGSWNTEALQQSIAELTTLHYPGSKGFDVALCFDATYLTKQVKKINKSSVVGVTTKQQADFENEKIKESSLVALSNMFAFIMTPIDAS
jgi:hypothetical protein